MDLKFMKSFVVLTLLPNLKVIFMTSLTYLASLQGLIHYQEVGKIEITYVGSEFFQVVSISCELCGQSNVPETQGLSTLKCLLSRNNPGRLGRLGTGKRDAACRSGLKGSSYRQGLELLNLHTFLSPSDSK